MKVGNLLACVALVLCASCKDDPVTPGTGDNTMTAVVDGLAVNPTSVTAVKSGGRIHIVGTGAFRTVTFSMVAPTTPTQVLLFRSDATNTALIAEGTPPNNPVWSTSNAPALADTAAPVYSTVEFTSVSETGLTATFALRVGPASGQALGVRFANGSFKVKF